MKYKYTTKELNTMRSCQFLTDRERKTLNWYYFRGWNIERVAAELDVSRATVFNILRSIRNKAFVTE